jgi:hypothetical protein
VPQTQRRPSPQLSSLHTKRKCVSLLPEASLVVFAHALTIASAASQTARHVLLGEAR